MTPWSGSVIWFLNMVLGARGGEMLHWWPPRPLWSNGSAGVAAGLAVVPVAAQVHLQRQQAVGGGSLPALVTLHVPHPHSHATCLCALRTHRARLPLDERSCTVLLASVERNPSLHRDGWPAACSLGDTGFQEPRGPPESYSTHDEPSCRGHTSQSTATEEGDAG
ncbi:hypothetical protein XENOCAPTIV_029325 [Xenoophorus captivus]|uniref:Secreted protein n=1 Tax=Xenoophorus captivus TaxID=1517983 RepID=A0ABV0RVM9_9TELE